MSVVKSMLTIILVIAILLSCNHAQPRRRRRSPNYDNAGNFVYPDPPFTRRWLMNRNITYLTGLCGHLNVDTSAYAHPRRKREYVDDILAVGVAQEDGQARPPMDYVGHGIEFPEAPVAAEVAANAAEANEIYDVNGDDGLGDIPDIIAQRGHGHVGGGNEMEVDDDDDDDDVVMGIDHDAEQNRRELEGRNRI
eukprot:114998_1